MKYKQIIPRKLCVAAQTTALVTLATLTNMISAQESASLDLPSDIVSKTYRQDAYSNTLGESLYDLGLAQQRANKHEKAVDTLKQATHMVRVNSGLHSALQLPIIEAEIESLMHLNLFKQVDIRQNYLRKIQARSLVDNEKIARSLIRQAEWQNKAYHLGIAQNDEEKLFRLVDMLNLYRHALTRLAEKQGELSPALLEPLHGILRTQYLLTGLISKSLGVYERSLSRFDNDGARAYRSQNFKQGKHIISAIYDVEKNASKNPLETTQNSLTMLADWMLWNGKRGDAKSTYMKATRAGLIPDDENLEETPVPAEIFPVPVPLPQLDGFKPLPDTVSIESANLLIGFDITKTGRAINVKRLDESDTKDGVARKIIRLISKTRFRPRLELGEVVVAEGITYGFDTSTW
ncbi:MAG: hypothetical protein P8J18_01850 [Halieaceae bacterium]|nr:hypothetical protein [Halieaceae bacterium]